MGSAEGAQKAAATRIGVSIDEYRSNIAAGLKHCRACRKWKPIMEFCADRSRGDGKSAACAVCVNANHRARYTPVPEDQRRPMGPPPFAPRSGDKKQARQRINVEVREGRRPHPNRLPCTDCGHVWKVGERRHEYDHHNGYGAEHHYDVEPVCTTCHAARESARGLYARRQRNRDGSFAAGRLLEGREHSEFPA